jgi:hypothetical protein
MDYVTDILTLIKGYNGTWAQWFVAGLYLNFRLICSFIVFLIYFKGSNYHRNNLENKGVKIFRINFINKNIIFFMINFSTVISS